MKGCKAHGAPFEDPSRVHELRTRALIQIAKHEIEYVRNLILACAADPSVSVRDEQAVADVMRQVANCIAPTMWRKFEDEIERRKGGTAMATTALWRHSPFGRGVRKAARTICRSWVRSIVFEQELMQSHPDIAATIIRGLRRRRPRRRSKAGR